MDRDPAQPGARDLSPDERLRYSRHLALPDIGEAGQRALKNASVLIVGAGGLGSPAALYLAAAGVGRIGIIDDDTVDLSNLQRQLLHGTGGVGKAKATSARERLRDINPLVQVDALEARLTDRNATELIELYDIVIDGSDNFPTRYLVNDACHFAGKPWVYGSVFRFEGQVSVFGPGSPCYRCLYPEPPSPGDAPNCAEAGVLGVLPGLIGTLQATEAIKLITGIGVPLSGHVLFYDALEMTFRKLRLQRDPSCNLCGTSQIITEIKMAEEAGCPAQGGPPAPNGDSDEVDPIQLQVMMRSDDPPVLIDIREPWEHDICDIEGSQLIPLGNLPERVAELPQDRTIVIFCRSGGRTRAALDRITGWPTRTYHLQGGILAWADAVDPSIKKY